MLKEGKKRKQCGRNVSGASKDEGSCGTMRFELSLVSFSQRQNIFLQYFFFLTFFVYFALGMQKSIKTDLCSKELTVWWGRQTQSLIIMRWKGTAGRQRRGEASKLGRLHRREDTGAQP